MQSYLNDDEGCKKSQVVNLESLTYAARIAITAE